MIFRSLPLNVPLGVKAFGRELTVEKVNLLIKTWRESINEIKFYLVLAGTRTAEVNGISAAGATPDSRRYTAVADAELLLRGPNMPRRWQLPPLPAGVTPALISYVSSRFVDIKPIVIPIGLSQSLPFPHHAIESTSLGPSECLSTGKAMPLDRVENLWNSGFSMGLKMQRPVLLAECVPGGTSTAQAVLAGLGLEVDKFISGSARQPPHEIKKKLVQRGLCAAKLGLNPLPKILLSAVGDPFQAFAVGFVLGTREAGQRVLLGGGCQMLAVIALALEELNPQSRDEFVQDILVATTAWLVGESISSDKSESSFVSLMELIATHFEVSLIGMSTGLQFHESTKQVLRDYELGYVKEGVGAGALSLLAQIKGVSPNSIVEACEIAVDQLEENP